MNSSITLTSAVSTAVSRMNGSTLDHVLVVDRKIIILKKKNRRILIVEVSHVSMLYGI